MWKFFISEKRVKAKKIKREEKKKKYQIQFKIGNKKRNQRRRGRNVRNNRVKNIKIDKTNTN